MDNKHKIQDDDDILIIEPIDEPSAKTKTHKPGMKTQKPLQKAPDVPIKRAVKAYSKYVCRKCNYKFTRKTGTTQALRCPYCSSDYIEEDTFDLNRAIREVE